jgi:hypothetical protein
MLALPHSTSAQLFFVMLVCALFVYCETGKRGTRFDPGHISIYAGFSRVRKVALVIGIKKNGLFQQLVALYSGY